MQKAITAITLAAVMICMTASIKAKAETIESSEIIAATVPGADLTSIAYAYTNLNDDQKLIADYLMGAYNYAYLCARGFSFNIDQNETNMKATLRAVGKRIFQYITTQYAWRSRFNEVFRQYASSIIVYASKQNVIFDTWINEILSGNRNVYIEYSDDAFDAWTEFYNDPSGDGIAHFGETVSEWDSGSFYDFAFVGLEFNDYSEFDSYNNFLLNQSPVIFTNTLQANSNTAQFCISFKNQRLCDTVYITRQNTTNFRYGYYDGLSVLPAGSLQALILVKNNSNGKVYNNGASNYATFRDGIQTNNNINNYQDLIQYAFNISPYYVHVFYVQGQATGYYEYLNHVILVDDLETLANPEEIFNVDSLNIIPPAMPDYIVSPNGKMLIPGYAPIQDPFAELWDVSVDVDNNPVSEDDFSTQIVNNTVINNYTVDASDKINVPVEWFENELTDQLANDTIPFLSFARDCIACLGDLQIYFYGAIVFGLGGGILKKLIL